jgi:ribonuclease HIII
MEAVHSCTLLSCLMCVVHVQVHEDLLNLQNSVSQQQIVIDQLTEDVHNARRLVEKSRPNHRGPHSDLERLEADVSRLTNRWENVCEQLVDRYESFIKVCM